MLVDEMGLAGRGVDYQRKAQRHVQAAREERYGLRDSVVEKLYFFLAQIGNEFSGAVADRERSRDQTHVDADRRKTLGEGASCGKPCEADAEHLLENTHDGDRGTRILFPRT